jgi:fructosamine-3-kinase
MALLDARLLEGHPALQKGFLDGYADTGELADDFWERLSVYRLLANARGLFEAHGKKDEASADIHRTRLRRALADLKR